MGKKVTTTTTTVTTVTEEIPTAVRKTYVALVLDRSSSMETMRDQAISLFNEQLHTLQNAPAESGEMNISLVTFASDVRTPIVTAAPKTVQPLTRDTYAPEGMTAMYDGMGRAISLLRRHESAAEDVAFLVVTITDGEENHSTEFSGTRLSNLIRELKATGRWTFTVAGANINVDKLADKLGIPKFNVMQYTPDAAGMQYANTSNVRGLSNYVASRAAGSTSSAKYYGDNDKDAT